MALAMVPKPGPGGRVCALLRRLLPGASQDKDTACSRSRGGLWLALGLANGVTAVTAAALMASKRRSSQHA